MGHHTWPHVTSLSLRHNTQNMHERFLNSLNKFNNKGQVDNISFKFLWTYFILFSYFSCLNMYQCHVCTHLVAAFLFFLKMCIVCVCTQIMALLGGSCDHKCDDTVWQNRVVCTFVGL